MKDRGIYIPPDIWKIKELSIAERILAAEIHKLQDTPSGCFASNSYFAELLGCSKESIKKYLYHLKISGIVVVTNENNCRKISIAGVKYYPPLGKGLPTPRVKDYPPLGKILPPTIYTEYTSKENTSKGASKKEAPEIVLPFPSKEFKEMWEIWITERKERKSKKYTFRGEQAALHNLQHISNDDEQRAIQIIQQSISQGWIGLFPLKEQPGATKRQLSADKLRAYIEE